MAAIARQRATIALILIVACTAIAATVMRGPATAEVAGAAGRPVAVDPALVAEALPPGQPIAGLGDGFDAKADALGAAQNACIARASGAELVVQDGELAFVGDDARVRAATRGACAPEAEAFAAFRASDRYRMAADAAEARARRIWSCIAEAGFALGAREVVARAGVAPSSLPAVVAACRAEA